jgi:hypothetical protein
LPHPQFYLRRTELRSHPSSFSGSFFRPVNDEYTPEANTWIMRIVHRTAKPDSMSSLPVSATEGRHWCSSWFSPLRLLLKMKPKCVPFCVCFPGIPSHLLRGGPHPKSQPDAVILQVQIRPNDHPKTRSLPRPINEPDSLCSSVPLCFPNTQTAPGHSHPPFPQTRHLIISSCRTATNHNRICRKRRADKFRAELAVTPSPPAGSHTGNFKPPDSGNCERAVPMGCLRPNITDSNSFTPLPLPTITGTNSAASAGRLRTCTLINATCDVILHRRLLFFSNGLLNHAKHCRKGFFQLDHIFPAAKSAEWKCGDTLNLFDLGLPPSH